MQDGYGTETWTDGSKYEGYYKQGKKEGQGIINIKFFCLFLIQSFSQALIPGAMALSTPGNGWIIKFAERYRKIFL